MVVPYPGAGNINPALQVAKLLHRHGAYVTFVNTEHNHRLVQDTEGAGAVRGREGFRFEAIPDGLSEADRGKQDYGRGLAVSTSTRCAAPLRDLIALLNATPGVPPVTCVLPTMLMSFALGVARDPDHGVLDRQRHPCSFCRRGRTGTRGCRGGRRARLRLRSSGRLPPFLLPPRRRACRPPPPPPCCLLAMASSGSGGSSQSGAVGSGGGRRAGVVGAASLGRR